MDQIKESGHYSLKIFPDSRTIFDSPPLEKASSVNRLNMKDFIYCTFLVGLAAVRSSEDLLPFLDLLGPHPWIRWAIVQMIPERYLAKIITLIGKKYGFVVELDLDGKLLRSYQDPTGTVIPDVSQVYFSPFPVNTTILSFEGFG